MMSHHEASIIYPLVRVLSRTVRNAAEIESAIIAELDGKVFTDSEIQELASMVQVETSQLRLWISGSTQFGPNFTRTEEHS